MWKNPWAVARFLLTAAVGLTIDLLVKQWAVDRLSFRNEPGHVSFVNIVPGWLQLQRTENQGAALGFFQGYRWMFLIVSTVAVAFLGYLFSTSRRDQRGYQFILGLLLAGVLGNLYDRLTLGYVRDMIHLFPGSQWPDAIAAHLPAFWSTRDSPPEWFPWIFNVADSLLCVGVALMLIYSILYGSPRPEESAAKVEPNAGES